MELTDAELSFLLNSLLDDAGDKVRHGLDNYDEEEKAAYDTLSAKAHAEARARKKVRPKIFWWVR
jgi:hypothetical protein